jgi:hypothetical protein
MLDLFLWSIIGTMKIRTIIIIASVLLAYKKSLNILPALIFLENFLLLGSIPQALLISSIFVVVGKHLATWLYIEKESLVPIILIFGILNGEILSFVSENIVFILKEISENIVLNLALIFIFKSLFSSRNKKLLLAK